MAGRPRREALSERLIVSVRPSFAERLEVFCSLHDLDKSEVLREGSDAFVNGYLPVLGSVRCGDLSEAIQQTPHYEMVPPKFRPRADLGDFILEAVGASMEPFIMHNDLVLLRPGAEFPDGGVCVVQYYGESQHNGDCESTLKRVFRSADGKTITLRAYNPEFEDITLPANRVKVVAVMRGLMRCDG